MINMCQKDDTIAVDLDKYSAPLDLKTLFGRPGPVHLELGSGKGTFLLNQARINPHFSYFGIEWANEYYRYSVDRMRRWQVENVRILRADGRIFIEQYLPDESIDTFHVYFPDPWPKNRHHKRRFFQPAVIAQVARCLVIGGEIRTATDHAEYFEVIKSVLLDDPVSSQRFEPVDFLPANTAAPGEWVGSNFERKIYSTGPPYLYSGDAENLSLLDIYQ